MSPSPRRLLLVGAGHAHLEILRRIALERPPELDVAIVAPEERHFYSGMTPGYLAGQYSVDEVSFDVPAIARRAGVECLIGQAAALDPAKRRVRLEDGRELAYDLVSLNIGALTAAADGAAHAERIKPLHRATLLKARLQSLAVEPAGARARVVVVGAGAAGVEVACAAAALLDAAGRSREVTVVDRGETILGGYGAAFQRRAGAALAALGIRCRLRSPVAGVEADRVLLGAGGVIPSDLTVWLTGPAAAPLLARSRLPVDERGFLWTDGSLRSVADPRVFAVGDCGTLVTYPSTPKAGVYAVRQAPALWHNLLASARGTSLAAFTPQRSFLSVLNTCDGRALLRYKRLVSWSRWAWRLKDSIDRRFMRRYQRLAS